MPDTLITVPEWQRMMFRRWRDTPSQGEIPILRKVVPRGRFLAALLCGDDRLCAETVDRLTKICRLCKSEPGDIVGSMWPIVVAGGALDFTEDNPELLSYQRMLVRELDKFKQAKRVPPGEPIDFIAAVHVDCGFGRVVGLDLRRQLERLRTAVAIIQTLLPSPQYQVRAGWDMYWPDINKHCTYELDVEAALNDLVQTKYDLHTCDPCLPGCAFRPSELFVG